MTNIQSAFLYEQLNDIESILANKKQIFENYETLLQHLIIAGKIVLFKKKLIQKMRIGYLLSVL